MSRDMTDRMHSRTSSTAVGPRLVVISLVTLVILGLSRPNILFIFVKGLIADTSGRVKSTNQERVLKHTARDKKKIKSKWRRESCR